MQNVFSFCIYRICSLYAECVPFIQNVFSFCIYRMGSLLIPEGLFSSPGHTLFFPRHTLLVAHSPTQVSLFSQYHHPDHARTHYVCREHILYRSRLFHNIIIPIMREHIMCKENIFCIGLVFCAQYDHPNHAWPRGDECQNETGNVLLTCC